MGDQHNPPKLSYTTRCRYPQQRVANRQSDISSLEAEGYDNPFLPPCVMRDRGVAKFLVFLKQKPKTKEIP